MIKVGIVGYGNLARGVECAVRQNPDLCLEAVFTRRDPNEIRILTQKIPVLPIEEAPAWKGLIDVMILCGGSAADLPWMTPKFAGEFNVVDSFDTHANIPAHFAAVDEAASGSGHLAVISVGWDPGIFSVQRLYGCAVLPNGADYTFWGKGVSQGHSDAIRRIPGVMDARQYTIPVPEAICRVRNGESPILTAREMHSRHCYVVVEEGADRAAVEAAIKKMPNYFADFDTTVEFVDPDTLCREHSGLPHGGTVIRSGRTGWEGECRQTMEYQLQLESNPQFTGSVLVACARAAARLWKRGERGCRTMLDLAPADLSAMSRDEMLNCLL